jgi:hypothetical protein
LWSIINETGGELEMLEKHRFVRIHNIIAALTTAPEHQDSPYSTWCMVCICRCTSKAIA